MMYHHDDEPIANILKILLVLLFWFALIFVITTVILRTEVSREPVSTKKITTKEYKIVTSFNNYRLNGYGEGNSSFLGGSWEMKISEEDKFTFYFSNSNNEIEKKEIPFNFKIIEYDKDYPLMTLNYDENKNNICRGLLMQDNCNIETEKSEEYHLLYIPRGTLNDVINTK